MTAKRCLIFGGSGALGGAICRTLSREGVQFVLTYCRNRTTADEIAAECNAREVLQCDIRSLDQVETVSSRAAATLGGLDAVIQAAGISGRTAFYQTGRERLAGVTSEDLDDMLNVNSRGSFNVCQAAIAALREGRQGNVVVVGAMDGVKPVPSPVHFAMSKAALRGLVESAAKELGRKGICINTVCPGILDGGASSELSRELIDEYLKHCALRRLGRMDEVAELVTWLALENTYLTGQCVLLDGGL